LLIELKVLHEDAVPTFGSLDGVFGRAPLTSLLLEVLANLLRSPLLLGRREGRQGRRVWLSRGTLAWRAAPSFVWVSSPCELAARRDPSPNANRGISAVRVGARDAVGTFPGDPIDAIE